MATALSNEPREYILEEERELPVEKQTVFIIKPISAREEARIADMAVYSGKTVTHEGETLALSDTLNKQMYERLLSGLVGWKNFKDDTGKDIPFNEVDREMNLDMISSLHRRELSYEILSMSIVTKDTEKN